MSTFVNQSGKNLIITCGKLCAPRGDLTIGSAAAANATISSYGTQDCCGLSVGQAYAQYGGWDKQIHVHGNRHSHVQATTNCSAIKMGIFAHCNWGGAVIGAVGTNSNHVVSMIVNNTHIGCWTCSCLYHVSSVKTPILNTTTCATTPVLKLTGVNTPIICGPAAHFVISTDSNCSMVGTTYSTRCFAFNGSCFKQTCELINSNCVQSPVICATSYSRAPYYCVNGQSDIRPFSTDGLRGIQIRSGCTSNTAALELVNNAGTWLGTLYTTTSHYGFLDSSWGGWDIKKAINGSMCVTVGSSGFICALEGGVCATTCLSAPVACVTTCIQAFRGMFGGANHTCEQNEAVIRMGNNCNIHQYISSCASGWGSWSQWVRYVGACNTWRIGAYDAACQSGNRLWRLAGRNHSLGEVNYIVAGPSLASGTNRVALYCPYARDAVTWTGDGNHYPIGAGGIICGPSCLRTDGHLCLTANTPYICTGGAYIIVPGGIYANAGTIYAEATIMTRNGICDDTASVLDIWGGNDSAKCTKLRGKTFVCNCLYVHCNICLAPDTSGDMQNGISLGKTNALPQASWGESGSQTGRIEIGLPTLSGEGGATHYGMVHVAIDVYEYNNNDATTIIVGGHNWNCRWYNCGAHMTGGCTDKTIKLAYHSCGGTNNGRYVILLGEPNSSWNYGSVHVRSITNGLYYCNAMDMGTPWYVKRVTCADSHYNQTSADLRTASNSMAGYQCAMTCFHGPRLCATTCVRTPTVCATSGSYYLKLNSGIINVPTAYIDTINNSGSTAVLSFSGGHTKACTCLQSPILCSTQCIHMDQGNAYFDGGSCNGANDATVYVTAYNNNDWGIIVNKNVDSASEYGLDLRMGATSTAAMYARFNNTVKFKLQYNCLCHSAMICSPTVGATTVNATIACAYAFVCSPKFCSSSSFFCSNCACIHGTIKSTNCICAALSICGCCIFSNNGARVMSYGTHYASSTDWDTIFNTAGQYGQVMHEIHNGTSWANSPGSSVYSYGGLLNWHGNGMKFQMYLPHTGSNGQGLYYRTNWSTNSWYGWARIWDSNNDGASSGLDADLLDGQHGSYYRNASNLNAGTVATARLGSGTASSSTYLRGDGTWAAVSSGGLCGCTATSSLFQTAVGYCAMNPGGGIQAIAIGYKAAQYAGQFSPTDNNLNMIAIGTESLNIATNSCYTVAIGYRAGYDNVDGKENTYIGSLAGQNNDYNPAGAGAVFLGYNAGMCVTRSCGSIFLGACAYGTTCGYAYCCIVIGNALTGGNTGTGKMCSGSFTFTGSVSKSSGSFRIVHPNPAKSETKDLWHSFVESPNEGDNLYRFSLDVTGCRGVITLPNYYRHLNKNDQIWVSPVGHFGAAYGTVTENQECAVICTNSDGCYNVLLVGTRKDRAATHAWKGTERDIDSNSPHAEPVYTHGEEDENGKKELLCTTWSRDMAEYNEAYN